jgi:aspartate aminotransferase
MSRRPAGLASAANVVPLSMGEPDFDTPAPIVDAAVDALRAGYTHYADFNGDPDLRALIAEQAGATRGRAVDPADVLVTHGGTAAITAAVLATVDPDDRVLVPEPTYSLYVDAVNLAGGTPVYVPTPPDHHLDLDALATEIDCARMVVLCNPVNPTGVVYRADELRAVAELTAGSDTLVLVDEAYANLIYDDAEFTTALAVEHLLDRLVYVQTLSKTYAMTGWRIGYVVAPPSIAPAIQLAHRTMNSSLNSAVQRAAITALRAGADLSKEMLTTYAERRDYVMGRLAGMPGVSAVRPDGAFYVLVRYPGDRPSEEVTRRLADAGVAVRAGREYGPGGEGHVRLSFAADLPVLAEGLDRMAAVFAELLGRNTS